MNWDAAVSDLQSALASGGYSSLLQTIIFSRNGTVGLDNSTALLRVTAQTPGIILPFTYANGTNTILGADNSSLTYPAALYPNITYSTTGQPDPADPSLNASIANAYSDFVLNTTSNLLLGPLQVNESYALVSLTLPIVDNTNPSIILAYMTVVAAASSLISITQSREGLASTGITLLVGPSRRENIFKNTSQPATADYSPPLNTLKSELVKFVFPPQPPSGQPGGSSDRHQQYKYVPFLEIFISFECSACSQIFLINFRVAGV